MSMQSLDFLPESYRLLKQKRKVQKWWIVVAALFLSGMVVATTLQELRRWQMRSDLAEVEMNYQLALASDQQYHLLCRTVDSSNETTALYMFLKHPWPKTQLLMAVLDPLPASATLTQLRLGKPSGPGTAERPDSQTESTEKPAEQSAAIKALQQLQERGRASEIEAEVIGTSTDLAAIHVYVGELAKSKLVKHARLRKVERLTDPTASNESRFEVVLSLVSSLSQTDVNEASTGSPDSARPRQDRVANRKPN